MAKREKTVLLKVTFPAELLKQMQAMAQAEDVPVGDWLLWVMDKTEADAKAAGMTLGDYVWWSSVQVKGASSGVLRNEG